MNETMVSGTPEDYLVGLTKPSVDRILKMENPGDCLALYTFYCYTRKWQKNSAVFATSEFAMTGLGWGRDRFSHAKKQLKKAGFIEDIHRNVDGGKIRWFVAVKFAQTATPMVSHPTENPHSGKSADKYLGMVKEIPSNGKEIQRTETSAMASDSKDELNFSFQTESTADANASFATAQQNDPPTNVKPRTRRVAKNSPPTEYPAELNCPAFKTAWEEFLQHRKEKKAPVTPTAQKNMFRKFVSWGTHTAIDAIDTSISNGWTGVFEPNGKKKTGLNDF